MWTGLARRDYVLAFLVLVLGSSSGWPDSYVAAVDVLPIQADFSGVIVKQVNGKRFQAQVFAKGNCLRLEYKYALRTDFGYAAIQIIRFDRSESWYLLAQRKELLVVPIDPEEVLPIRAELPGERSRAVIGDALVAGRAAGLFEIQTEVRGRIERFHEWVDAEMGIVLKLVSLDRDWGFEYERIRISPQPSYYFDEPTGYRKRMGATGPRRNG